MARGGTMRLIIIPSVAVLLGSGTTLAAAAEPAAPRTLDRLTEVQIEGNARVGGEVRAVGARPRCSPRRCASRDRTPTRSERG
jgi:hypothetical protein